MNFTRDISSILGFGSMLIATIGTTAIIGSTLPLSIPAMIALGVAGLLTEKSYKH